MIVLYGTLAPGTWMSAPFLQECKGDELRTVKVISDLGNSSTPNGCVSLRALSLRRRAFPWCSDENSCA